MGKTEAAGAGRPRLLQRPGDQGLRRGGHHAYRAQADDLQRKAEGRFDKRDFIYIAKRRRVPVPGRASARSTASRRVENGLTLHTLLDLAPARSARSRRSARPSDYRRITRWEHEAVLEAMQRRLDRKPEAMTLRRRTVEHVVRNAQALDGLDALPDARRSSTSSTEMSLHVLAYNLKRVMQHPRHRQDDEGDEVGGRLSAFLCPFAAGTPRAPSPSLA